MARGYKATLEVKCWKEHACCYCGAAYRYLLSKRRTGHGASQTDAVSAARTGAVRALRSRVEMMPCPSCGHFQPDMIGRQRLRRHAVVFVGITALFILTYVAGMTYTVSGPATLWVLFFGAAAAWIAYTWIGCRNPNHRIRANKAFAERLVQQKRLHPVTAEADRDDRPRPVVIETGAGFWVVYFLLVGATVALMPGAEVIRMGNGWPWNPLWHGPIVGPGDTAWIWVQPEQPIQSLRGEWKATGSAKLVNGADKKDDKKDDKNEWRVTSRTSFQGAVNDADRMDSPALWARVHIPNQRPLAHKRLDLEVTLHVITPELGEEHKGGRVVQQQHDVTVPIKVHLARPFAGYLYGFFWSVAMLGGGAMFLLAGGYHLMSDWALVKQRPPTRVTALTDAEAESLQQSRQPVAAPAAPNGQTGAETVDLPPASLPRQRGEECALPADAGGSQYR